MDLERLLKVLTILALSLLPGFEGRYAVAAGRAMGLDVAEAFALASLATLVLATALPLSMSLIDAAMYRWSTRGGLRGTVGRTYLRYIERARTRAEKYVEKWGFLGLVIFVAIPLPMTGVWTGAIAAHILGIPRAQTIAALSIGGILANIIVASAVYGIDWLVFLRNASRVVLGFCLGSL